MKNTSAFCHISRHVFASLAAFFILHASFFISCAAAQPRRPLKHGDFDGWRSIATPEISLDGKWIACSFMPLEGDGDVIVRELATSREITIPVGALPPVTGATDANNHLRAAQRRKISLAFTSDAQFLVATTFPGFDALRAAKRAKTKADNLPKDGLVIVNTQTGNTERIARVKNMQVPSHGGQWLAYLKEPAPEKPKPAPAKKETKESGGGVDDSDENPATPGEENTAAPETKNTAASATKKPATPPKKKKDVKYGSNLVLRDLSCPPKQENATRVFRDVLDYYFSRDGRVLVFVVSSRTPGKNGVYAVTPGDPSPPRAIISGPGCYQKFTWDRRQTQALFVSDRADPDATVPCFALYHWKRGDDGAFEIVSASTPGMPPGHGVSNDNAATFSHDGRIVIVPAAPIRPPPDPRLEKLLDEEKVTADLWHWRDDYLPPMQKVRHPRELKRSYAGVYDLATGRYTQLASPELDAVTVSDDGTRAFGLDNRAYRARGEYDELLQDLYLVNTSDGAKKLVLPKLNSKPEIRWSPNGRWISFYDNRHWFSIDASDGSIRNLTEKLPVAFHDELHDMPGAPPACGVAGWARDGESLLVYDRYDLWQLFPDGRPARNITQGHGRAAGIQFRIQDMEAPDPEKNNRGIDTKAPLVLRGEDQKTRATGFYRTTFDTATGAVPKRLLWDDKNHECLKRQAEAPVLLLTISRFDEYPDLHVTTLDFDAPRKVSNGGAQLEKYLWGSAELVNFRGAAGQELSAALYKPADFDPAKKYPMIVYIYERRSDRVHAFRAPAPSNSLNHTYYTSNGYLVLMPDIAYTTGHPGRNALECVLPAIDEVARRGYVNEKAIGIQGHSWGGYQTAFLITQTNRFRAAAAGATVSNMTSAYSGIRWGSGRPRQSQYEKGQSRIGAPLSDSPEPYMENSPLFAVSRIKTPLLMLHNDRDDAVPWEQGIELFLAMRRAGKEVYMFNYNNARHNLFRRADQYDYSMRMSQFFGHFLKGDPAPEWMKNGIPYRDREVEKLDFREANK